MLGQDGPPRDFTNHNFTYVCLVSLGVREIYPTDGSIILLRVWARSKFLFYVRDCPKGPCCPSLPYSPNEGDVFFLSDSNSRIWRPPRGNLQSGQHRRQKSTSSADGTVFGSRQHYRQKATSSAAGNVVGRRQRRRLKLTSSDDGNVVGRRQRHRLTATSSAEGNIVCRRQRHRLTATSSAELNIVGCE